MGARPVAGVGARIARYGRPRQDAALHVLARLDVFEPRHVGAMQAYLRKSVINRICDEVRKVTRRPASVELPEDHPADATSPIEAAIEAESYERYRDALGKLSVRDRKMVVARSRCSGHCRKSHSGSVCRRSMRPAWP
jgi:hypothetical protein